MNLIPTYVIIKRGNRLFLEYRANGSRVKYASCNAVYEPLIRLIVKDSQIYDIIQVMRVYIAIKAIPHAKGKEIKLVDVIREMRDFEALFWYVKISKHGLKAISAFKKLYLD